MAVTLSYSVVVIPTTTELAAILASAGLVLAVVALARRVHTPDTTRRGGRALALLGAALFAGGVGLAAAELWRERSGLLWGDLMPLALGPTGSQISNETQASLIRRLRAERLSEPEAKRVIDRLREEERTLQPELVTLLKRAAWSEADVLGWMSEELPRRVRAARESPESPDVRLAFLPFDPLRFDTPPIDASWLEAHCLRATLDGTPLSIRSPLGDEVPARGVALEAPWTVAIAAEGSGSRLLKTGWRFTLRWRPTGDVAWIDYMDPSLRRNVSVEVSLSATLGSLASGGEWSVTR